jgi:predicted metalloprotease
VAGSRRPVVTRPVAHEQQRLLFLVAVAAAVVALIAGLVASGVTEDRVSYSDPFDRWPPVEVAGSARSVGGAPALDADLERLLTFVSADVQRFWAQQFQRSGMAYRPARVTVFHRRVQTGCGPASAATGPFYCTLDQTIYLDPGFFRELAVAFRAPGDFAQAYVIAHEAGHHVQNLTGITLQVDHWIGEGAAPPNLLSIAMELQADCFAGVWSHSTYERGLLEDGDVEEALRAAAAVGDDRIQARATGRIDPETWTHGSSEQRLTWFTRGFETGAPAECDTFSRLG